MRLNIITELEQRLDEHARMDFAFLYSEATSLLSVGYNCDTNMPDKSHYDLLPSEIRLTSFLAIATNQLPLKSWYALGRLFTTIDNETALMSWSGSMFEYLMPNLVMPTARSLLDEMSQSAVMRQIHWGKNAEYRGAFQSLVIMLLMFSIIINIRHLVCRVSACAGAC